MFVKSRAEALRAAVQIGAPNHDFCASFHNFCALSFWFHGPLPRYGPGEKVVLQENIMIKKK